MQLRRIIAAFVLFGFGFYVAASAAATLPPAANAGIAWLQSQLNADGSLKNDNLSIATPLQSRSETANALAAAGTVPPSLAGAVSADTGSDTESLSRHVIALVQGGQSPIAAVQVLYANQNADGGFGSQPGDSSDALDTAFALLALHVANDTSANNLSNALLYLVGNANSDGGYGLPAGGSGSQVYVTAYVLLAYQAYAGSYPLGTQISSARQWLTGQQSGGVYADTLSDALASLALASSSNDASAYGGALAALTAGQQADGSWSEDPYLTALSVRALSIGVAQSTATTGIVNGTVLDSNSHLPIVGASVQLGGTASVTATSNSSGSFSISGLAPGTYTLSVTAAGYAGANFQSLQVNAGASTTVGAIALTAVSSVGGLVGMLTDASGAPLAGAVITLSGADTATTVSGADGRYSFAGLVPGAVTVTITLAGYDTVTAPLDATGGAVLLFSPSLYPTNSTPTTANLNGTVQDAGTQAPISGATVMLGATAMQTDGNGHFSIAGLTPGSYSATVSAGGYSSAALEGDLSGGANSAGLVLLTALAPAGGLSNVSGVITDANTGAPVAGASVQVQNTAVATVSDAAGHYQLTGISGNQFVLMFTAPGYLSRQSVASLAAPGSLVLNTTLTAAASTGLLVQSVDLNQQGYEPYSEAEIEAEIDNTTTQDQQVVLDAKVIDALGNVVQDIPAKGLNLSTPPSAALQTIPAGGNLDQEFTFYVRGTGAGDYRIVIQATDAGGNVLAEGGNVVTVNPLAKIGGGLTLNPPISQANSNLPIHITGNLTNMGNLPVPAAQLQLTVKVGDTTPPSALPTPPVALTTYYASNAGIGGFTRDAQGNVYVVDSADEKVIEYTSGRLSTVIKTLPTQTSLNDSNLAIQPVGIARDPSGNLWILNAVRLLIKLDTSGNLTFIDTGLPNLRFVTADQSGDLYITGVNGANNLLVEMSPSGQFTTLVQNGLSKPVYVAAGLTGDLFVTNFGDNTIRRIGAGGAISTFATGLSGPQGIAADASGNLYVANSGANDILMFSPTGVSSVYATGFSGPSGVALDGAGNLYVTNTGNNAISKVSPGGAVSTYAQSATSNPQGMRYDAQGNLYVANAGNNTVTEIDTAGIVHVLASGLSTPEQVALDASGNLYVTNNGSGSISKVSGGVATTFATGLNQPYGLTFDPSGNLFVAEAGATRISEIPAGSSTPQVIAAAMLRSPGAVITAPDGSLVVANSNGITDIPLAGGGQVLATASTGSAAPSFDPNGALYYTTGTSLFKVANGAATLFATIPNTNAPVVFDASGNYYVADTNNKRIDKISGGVSTVFATLSGSPTWLSGDAAGNLYAVVGNASLWKITPAGVVTQITNSHLTTNIRSAIVDPNGRLIVINVATSSSIVVMGTDGSTQAFITGLSAVGGATGLANGNLAVTDSTSHALRIYSLQGVVQQTVWGFGSPHDMVWKGSTLYFDDTFGRVYTLVPGAYPVMLATATSGFFDFSGGQIYYTLNGSVATLDTSTLKQVFFYTLPNNAVYNGALTAVALRSDGAMAVADPTSDQLVEVSATKAVTAVYTGINNPVNIALDPSGHIFVAARMGSFNTITELGPADTTAKPVAVLSGANGMAFDAAGNLYLCGGTSFGVYEANLSTGNANPTLIANSTANTTLGGMAVSNGTLYVADTLNQAVRAVVGKTLPEYAVGIASPYGVRVGPDGAVYVADRNSGSVLRYSQTGLAIYVSGMSNPNSLNFDSNGTMYVGNTAATLYKVSSTGQPVDMGLEALLGGSTTFADVNVDNANEPWIMVSELSAISTVVIPKPPVLPSPGTVVYSTTITAPAMPLGAPAAPIDFGTWTPNLGGDYTVTVTSTGSGVAGDLTGSLHVGPYAQGQLSASASSVPPGTQPLNLTLSMQGLDFSSIATVSPNIQFAVTAGAGTVPPAMGVDPQGDLEFLQNGTLKRISLNGTVTTFTNVGQTQPLAGDLPIDSQGRVFIPGGQSILLYDTSTKTSTTYAKLGGVTSMTLTQMGTLYAGVGDTIYAVAPDGSFKLFYSSPTFFSGLAADEVGDVYLQTNNDLVMVRPNGTASLLDNKGSYEGEGRNVAGSCANNMFFTPGIYPGSGQAGEEHTLMEYVGDTGQIAKVFDGAAVSSALTDMDFITYDPFHSDLVIWTDGNAGQIYSVPVYCGGIDVAAHVITPAGQTLSGFSGAPTQTISHSDGSTEYVWDLKTVTTLGAGLQFGTSLANLQIGQTQPVVQSAFLSFQNSFVPGTSLTLPLTVPNVMVAPAVAMTVSTDAPSYPANSPVNVSIGLNNSSATVEGGMLDVQVVDASGNQVVDIDTQTATIAASSSATETAAWNTATYLNGSYSVFATLKDPNGVLLAQGTAQFAIGATSTTGGNGILGAGVTTDKASYGPTDTVVVDDRLSNGTSNAIADGISFTTTVTNPDGSVRWTNTSTLAELVPGGLRDITFPLALANAPPGTYGVSLVASLNGTALPAATASFTVQSSAGTAAGVIGTVVVAPAQAPLTSTVTLSGSISDNGNAALSNATATLAVLDPVAGQLVFQSPVNVPSLGIGKTVPVQASWTAAGTVNQTYVALLMTTANGVTKTLAQANFKLLDPTSNLTGTLIATPAQVQLTAGLTLTGAVSNSGPAITGVTATLSIQDPTGATVFTSPVNIGSLAQGQAGQVLANWLAAGPINETYTATLTVSVGSYTKTLAQASFMVIPPPIKIAAGLAEGSHGRVLILTDDPAAYPGNQDPFGPNPAPGLAAQNQHLGAVLKAAGWSYTLVTNADDFATQFNTGGYEVYVILSEAVKLPESLQESLDQAVANGAGLIVAGNHDDRNNKLEDALGVHSTGKSLSATGIVLSASALEASGGQASFGIDGQPLSVNKASAGVLGSFNLTGGGSAPAVFSNAYGTGKAVYMAFDLALEAAQTPGSFLDQLLTDTLGYVHPASLTPYTGRVIPLTLTVQNQGIATPAVATLALPAGVSVIDPNGATVSGSTLSWTLNLTVGETATETAWIKLPATAGSISVTGEVDSGVPPALTSQATPSLLIGVQTKP